MSNNVKNTAPPEAIEVRVSQSWVRLVRFCQTELPHGDLKIRIVNAQPTELLEAKRKVRFDKEETIPEVFGEA